jgi:hypothetical protein
VIVLLPLTGAVPLMAETMRRVPICRMNPGTMKEQSTPPVTVTVALPFVAVALALIIGFTGFNAIYAAPLL